MLGSHLNQISGAFSALPPDPNVLLPAEDAARMLGIPKETVVNWRKLLQPNLSEEEFLTIQPFAAKRFRVSPRFTQRIAINLHNLSLGARTESEFRQEQVARRFQNECSQVAKILFGNGAHAASKDVFMECDYVPEGRTLRTYVIHRDRSSKEVYREHYAPPTCLIFLWSSRDTTQWVENSPEGRDAGYSQELCGIISDMEPRLIKTFRPGHIVVGTDQHYHGAIPARQGAFRLLLHSFVNIPFSSRPTAG